MADGGKLKRRLKAGLKQRKGGQKKGRARLVLTNCFGICPKDAAVTASAATFARGEVLLIRDCSEESIKQATAALTADRSAMTTEACRERMRLEAIVRFLVDRISRIGCRRTAVASAWSPARGAHQ